MRLRTGLAALFAVWMGATNAPVAASPAELGRLVDEHWAWTLKSSPVLATTLGVREHDDRLSDLSLTAIDREAAEAGAFLARARAIGDAGLSPADRLNRDILKRLLARQVEEARYGQRQMLFSNRNGWHTSAANLPDRLPFYTRADFDSYIARLNAYPAQNAQGIATTRGALAGGFTLPCQSMGGFEGSISAQIVADPATSVFYAPFAKPRPATISAADWAALQARARAAIADNVVPAYRAFLAFYTADYAPRCQRSPAAAALPRGREYYAMLAREFTTTTMDPEAIHALGLTEVARIKAEMEAVVARSGFAGDRKAYIARLRTDPALYAKSPQELLEYAGALAKRIDGEMPRLFGRLPRLPYTIKPIPAAIAEGTTTAYYEGGAAETGRPGVYRVNTSKLDQRPLFEMPALGVHEAVPGHHHQIALQQELDLPQFRRHAAWFTAFSEGWGLYSERLGIEMGLYDTPERDMGRLSYEMWRACRLVVDTGLHAKGWSKAEAIAFMTENTALSAGNIEAEVNRYIAGPGQALAYKIGELRIRALRSEAERRLGDRFDIRAFHDSVLENGAVPLDVLEAHVRGWIARAEAGGATAR